MSERIPDLIRSEGVTIIILSHWINLTFVAFLTESTLFEGEREYSVKEEVSDVRFIAMEYYRFI
jgi:hypothetical protein